MRKKETNDYTEEASPPWTRNERDRKTDRQRAGREEDRS